jgi:hypothetical protein
VISPAQGRRPEPAAQNAQSLFGIEATLLDSGGTMFWGIFSPRRDCVNCVLLRTRCELFLNSSVLTCSLHD